MPPEPPRQPDVFLSYSHSDRQWAEALVRHLKPHGVPFWTDDKIAAGSNWRDEIQRQLESASVAVLLVSPQFLTSDFVMQWELPALLANARAGRTKLLLVLVSPVNTKLLGDLGEYRLLNETPLSALAPKRREELLAQTATDIQKASQRGTCFVTAPASAEFREVRDLIANVLTELGVTPLTFGLALRQSPSGLASTMAVRDADLVVADITSFNPNVMYELGLAHAFGKPTILLAQDDLTSMPSSLSGNLVLGYRRTELPQLGAALKIWTSRLLARGSGERQP